MRSLRVGCDRRDRLRSRRAIVLMSGATGTSCDRLLLFLDIFPEFLNIGICIGTPSMNYVSMPAASPWTRTHGTATTTISQFDHIRDSSHGRNLIFNWTTGRSLLSHAFINDVRTRDGLAIILVVTAEE